MPSTPRLPPVGDPPVDPHPTHDPPTHAPPTHPPPPSNPLPAQPPPPADTTPSITSWTRLEPKSRDAQMQSTINARVFDPLWMLTRQWQVGEFQGEDTGSPVTARVRAQSAMLSRCYLGECPENTQVTAPTYDSDELPLEVLVERRRVRLSAVTEIKQLRLTVDAGLHFLRMLEQQSMSRSYREAFMGCYALALPDAEHLKALDIETQHFLAKRAGRAVWIPFLPVQLAGPLGSVISRLERGAVLQPDGSQQLQTALSGLLNTSGPLLLHDEEVPREGIRVTRHYQMARWTDGSTFAWLAHRKQVGKGEGSSGLRFDSIEGPAQ